MPVAAFTSSWRLQIGPAPRYSLTYNLPPACMRPADAATCADDPGARQAG